MTAKNRPSTSNAYRPIAGALLLWGVLWTVGLPCVQAQGEKPRTAEDLRPAIEQIVMRYAEGWKRNDVDMVLSVFSRDYKDSEFDFRGLKREFNTFLKEIRDVELTLQVDEIRLIDERRALAFTLGNLAFTDRADNRRFSAPLNKVLFLEEGRGGWRVFSRLDFDPAEQASVGASGYRSQRSNYEFQIPPDWLLVAQPMSCCGCDEHIVALSPDLEARIGVYALTLPIELTAEQAVLADTPASSILERKELRTPRGVDGYQIELEHKGTSSRHRITKTYFTQGQRCWAFIYDHMDKKVFEEHFGTYEQVVGGFDVLSPGGSRSPTLAVPGGEIHDRIYTNTDLGLQVAAPKGWTLDLGGSHRDHPRLTLRTDAGQSTVQFLVRPVTEGQTPQDLADEAFAALEDRSGLSARKISQRPIRLDGNLKGLEVVLDLEIAQIGKLRRRAVFCVDGPRQYVFLCDAIPASEYSRVEKDFDTIIESLTRN